MLNYNIPDVINDIVFVDSLGTTPAMCFRKTREVFISQKFLDLPEDYQKFILAHESGHIAKNTKNEFLADDYATDWCISQGMSLTNTLLAMTDVLSFPDNRPKQKKEQEMRCERQFNRLFDYDANINKNPKAMTYINETVSDELDSFGGRGKARRTARRTFRAKKKAVKRSGKLGKISAKKSNKVNKIVAKGNKNVNKIVAKDVRKTSTIGAKTSNKVSRISNRGRKKNPAPIEIEEYYNENPNIEADQEEVEMIEPEPEEVEEIVEEVEESEPEEINEIIDEEYESFLGFGKAGKERRANRAQKNKDKNDAKKMKAEASVILAKQGIVNKGLGGIGEAIAKINPFKKNETTGEENTIMGMSATTFFIILAALILLGFAIWYFKFRKK